MTDLHQHTLEYIDRQKAIDTVLRMYERSEGDTEFFRDVMVESLKVLPAAQPEPEASKYEYHYDHTDCIWFRPEARNRCPSTCAQYRDGWNDAMQYIFRDGKGYRPFRRDEPYER